MQNNSVKTYRVFELNRIIKDILETSCSYPVWVQGELSDFDKNRSRPNIYFQISEKDARKNETLSSIKCVLYESRKELIRTRLREAGIKISGMDGLNVRFQVRLTVSARYGNYLLEVQDIDPAFTLGQLAQNRQETINWLKKKGLLDRNKEKPLGLVPMRIALITNEGEGYHDFIAKLQQSGYGFKVLFYQASVQGPRVEKEVMAGLNQIMKMSDQIEAVVIIRGGGSTADLSWFDSRKLAEAVAGFPKPVLTGIGHFTNISVVDMAAYRHLATPTAVAEFLVGRVNEFSDKIEDHAGQIGRQAVMAVKMAAQSVNHLGLSIDQRARQICDREERKAGETKDELPRMVDEILKRAGQKQENLKSKLDLMDPANIMRRGFSLTRFRGRSLKDVRSLKKGDRLTTVLFRGEVESSVDKLK